MFFFFWQEASDECPVYTGTFHSKETEMGQCVFKPSVRHIYTFRCEPHCSARTGELKDIERNTDMEKTPLLLLKKNLKKLKYFQKPEPKVMRSPFCSI